MITWKRLDPISYFFPPLPFIPMLWHIQVFLQCDKRDILPFILERVLQTLRLWEHPDPLFGGALDKVDPC